MVPAQLELPSLSFYIAMVSRDIIMCDTKGAIYEGDPKGMNDGQRQK